MQQDPRYPEDDSRRIVRNGTGNSFSIAVQEHQRRARHAVKPCCFLSFRSCAFLFTVAAFFKCSPIPEGLQQYGEGCDGRTAIDNMHENLSEVGKEVLQHQELSTSRGKKSRAKKFRNFVVACSGGNLWWVHGDYRSTMEQPSGSDATADADHDGRVEETRAVERESATSACDTHGSGSRHSDAEEMMDVQRQMMEASMSVMAARVESANKVEASLMEWTRKTWSVRQLTRRLDEVEQRRSTTSRSG